MSAAVGNGMGIRGVGNKIRLHITRGLDDFGYGFESDVRRAMLQCAGNGAKIINLSLGGSEMAATMDAMYKQFVEERGIMLFAASGNEGINAHSFPASHPSVISVGGVFLNGDWAPFSNYNDQVVSGNDDDDDDDLVVCSACAVHRISRMIPPPHRN